ncbi:hypothetical protein QYF61_018436 [Mycteria americana]|uniref:Uncharacterized protein n=1 Tax=Mycteria americana TaxID=33587 RepID=A0AAN7RL20_MYCAM|nr:hypothetical protein QYF61_018436 [Mycteria americana]
MCWGLAHAYQALFNTIQNPQGVEKVFGSDDKTTDTMATPASSATGTTATPATHATSTAAAPAPPVTGTAVQPGNQPMLVSVAPIHKKKFWKQKSGRLERDDEKAGPTQGEEVEERVDEMQTTRSISLSELCQQELNHSTREGGIDKAIGKGALVLSIWRQLLSGMKEIYSFKEDAIYRPSKWTTME